MPAQTYITIDAPPERVWDVLTDFPQWPNWQTWFTAMKSHDAEPEVGTKLTFTNAVSEADKPGTYDVRMVTWEPTKEFAWKGGPMPESLGFLMRGFHWFRLIPDDGGQKTKFDHGEDIEGLLRIIVPNSLVQKLAGSADKFNRDLKAKVEGTK